MSNSQHPIALRLERRVGGATRLLATVMALPLVDGIFAAMVLAGILNTVGGILQVGLLVFGGSAMVAVVLAEMEGSRRSRLRSIGMVGVGLVILAAAEAALAPTIESVLNLGIFERFAALVIAAVAAKTASAQVGDLLPRPAAIVGLGVIASLDPAGAELVLRLDPELIARAVAAAGVAVAFAAAVAILAPTLHEVVDLDRFRFGSAVALGVLPLSLLGVVPGNAPLAVLGVAGLLAFDPSGAESIDGWGSAGEASTVTDGGQDDDADGLSDQTQVDDDRAPWM